MKFICIMGRKGSGREDVETHLSRIGFKRIISYTTREPINNEEIRSRKYKFVSDEQFNRLIKNNNIIEFEILNGDKYGIPKPYGDTRFVSVVGLNAFRALREKYGKEQVFGVYLKCNRQLAIDRIKKENTYNQSLDDIVKYDDIVVSEMESEADIIIDSSKDMESILALILRAVR